MVLVDQPKPPVKWNGADEAACVTGVLRRIGTSVSNEILWLHTCEKRSRGS